MLYYSLRLMFFKGSINNKGHLDMLLFRLFIESCVYFVDGISAIIQPV